MVARVLGGTPKGEAELVLAGVHTISSAAQSVQISPLLMLESGGVAYLYADQRQFYDQHRRLWEILNSPEVTITHQGGEVRVTPQPKTWRDVGVRFWLPWLVALLSLSVGLGIWLFSPNRALGRLYVLASIGFTHFLLVLATSSSRLLSQGPDAWFLLNKWAQLNGYLFAASLAMILWLYPTRLGTWRLAWGMGAYAAFWNCVNWLELVPAVAVGFRMPIALFLPFFAWLLSRQWAAAAGDPVKRAQLKWFIALFGAAFSSILVVFVFAINHAVQGTTPQAYGFMSMSLLFIGLIPLATRLQIFELERWWVRAWVWFLGGVMVLLFDLLLVWVFPLQWDNAALIGLALMGWVYFPVRQWAWAKLSAGVLPDTRDVLPDIVALATRGGADRAALNARWRDLWERLFQPLRIVPGQPIDRVSLHDQGRILCLPGDDLLDPITLTLARRGVRLFTPADAKRAEEIVTLVRHGLVAQAAHERGVQEERRRIASDLHDDLGARLLSIAQLAGSGPTADLARQALEDMRLSVRGLTAGSVNTADALADWRSEVMGRCEAAGVVGSWRANEVPADWHISARVHMQLTRILRESVTNALRHSGAAHLSVALNWSISDATLTVEDNGRGLGDAQQRPAVERGGHGLLGLERRVRHLGGLLTFSNASPGTRVAVWLPLVPAGAQVPATDAGVAG